VSIGSNTTLYFLSFKKIPDIIYDYDDIEFVEKDSKGTPLIRYHKQFNDGTSIYVEEIRTKHKNLMIKTMYKTKNKKANNSGVSVEVNPQRSEYASIYIITHKISTLIKLAYSKSEAGTADNKAKNEDDEDGKKDDKSAENEDNDKEKAKNKCKNALFHTLLL